MITGRSLLSITKWKRHYKFWLLRRQGQFSLKPGGGSFKTFCTGMLKKDLRISTISITRKVRFCDPSQIAARNTQFGTNRVLFWRNFPKCILPIGRIGSGTETHSSIYQKWRKSLLNMLKPLSIPGIKRGQFMVSGDKWGIKMQMRNFRKRLRQLYYNAITRSEIVTAYTRADFFFFRCLDTFSSRTRTLYVMTSVIGRLT